MDPLLVVLVGHELNKGGGECVRTTSYNILSGCQPTKLKYILVFL